MGYDYAVLTLDCAAAAAQPRNPMGMSTFSNNRVREQKLHFAGYGGTSDILKQVLIRKKKSALKKKKNSDNFYSGIMKGVLFSDDTSREGDSGAPVYSTSYGGLSHSVVGILSGPSADRVTRTLETRAVKIYSKVKSKIIAMAKDNEGYSYVQTASHMVEGD